MEGVPLASRPTESPRPVRVLGVDPGLTRCGVAVVDGPPARPVHAHHGCVRTPSDAALERRLVTIHDAIAGLIREYRPTVVAVERVLFSRNVRTAMATGQAAGVVLLAAARADVDVVQITPTDVKLSVAGDGGADKDGVARMVTAQLGLAARPTPADAADALAVALAALARDRLAPARSTGTAGAAGGSWADLVARRGLRVAGGTGAAARKARP